MQGLHHYHTVWECRVEYFQIHLNSAVVVPAGNVNQKPIKDADGISMPQNLTFVVYAESDKKEDTWKSGK